VPIDLDEYRKASHESWDRFAPNWEREREFLRSATATVTDRLVARLDPQAGETVLELAAGTGDTGFAAAKRIGEEGRLISTDFAASMVEVARRVGEERGVSNAEHRVLDAERMDLDDSSVDGVLCRWGYMLMADPAAALAETRRVLRDGGRLSFAVWAAPERNLWAAIPGMVLVERGHMPPPEPGAPGIFGMADPDRIRRLVAAAGFGDPEVEEVAVRWNYPDVADYWAKTLALAAPIAEAFAPLEEAEQERVRALVMERANQRLDDDDAGLDGTALAVLAE
jgi:SAM-dependent methyltransferase